MYNLNMYNLQFKDVRFTIYENQGLKIILFYLQ